LKVRLSGGRVLTTVAKVRVARAPAVPHGTVRQPFVAGIASRRARTRAVHTLLRSLPTASRKRRPKPLSDDGSFVLRVLGGFRPGAATLLAPVLHAATRGQVHIDFAHRSARATYLLTSPVTRTQTCLAIRASYSGAGARGTLTTLGGTGIARRLRLHGSFRLAADKSLTRGALYGTLQLRRASARPLPAACRALRHR
jgi:hypothetical protein